MQTTLSPKALAENEGLRLQSGPGRDLVFKLTGDDTNGACDFFTVDVAPRSGPPLHLHRIQDESIFVLKGHFKVACGDETYQLSEGGFAYLPAVLPHAFFNLTEEDGRIIVVYTPGGGHHFYQEFGPAARSGASREELAAIFERHEMQLLGPPLNPQ